MRDYCIRIAGIAPLHQSCDGSEVERKYDLAISMLELIMDNSGMLDYATVENFIMWVDDALDDIWRHKEKLPDYKRAEFNCLHRLVSAGRNISCARQYPSRIPPIRAAEEARIRYWSKVARQTQLPTPRAQKIAEKLQSRYQW